MLTEVGGVGSPSPSPHRQTQAARAFGGQLQPSRCNETQAGGFGHDGGQPRMAKAFLETGEEGSLVPGLDIDHPVRPQTGLTQGGGEEVGAGHAPQYLTGSPGDDPCREKGGRSAVHSFLASACDLVDGAQSKAAAREMAIEVCHPEGQHGRCVPAALLKGVDLIAQCVEPSRKAGVHERPPVPKADKCSCNVLVLYGAESQPSLVPYPLRRAICGSPVRAARVSGRWLFW